MPTPERDGLFNMANLPPKRTGLPFVVWISAKVGAGTMFMWTFRRVRRSAGLNWCQWPSDPKLIWLVVAS